LIYDVVDPEANIIVGAVVDDNIDGEIHVTVIATGFEGGATYRPQERSTSAGYSGGYIATPQERGAKIPPFLLNRQGRNE
jgi:cell division protein FtsZ